MRAARAQKSQILLHALLSCAAKPRVPRRAAKGGIGVSADAFFKNGFPALSGIEKIRSRFPRDGQPR